MTNKISSAISLWILWSLLFSLSQAVGQNSVKSGIVYLSDFPSQDLPTAIDRENLIGESGKNFYYGVGVPVDYVKARYAAMLEMDSRDVEVVVEESEPDFSPPAILMMIYANGFGVQKNIDLSVRLAQFNVPGTPSEIDERIKHLKRMNSFFHGVFDICDDVPSDSGYQEICEKDRKIDNGIREMLPYDLQTKLPNQIKWTQQQIVAFSNLEKASNDYFSRRIYKELDLNGIGSGSARDEFASDETNQLENNFLEILNLLENEKFPSYSKSTYLKADSDLKHTYTKVLHLKDLENYGTITPIVIRVVQRRWVNYREAWVQFAALRYPKVSSDSMRKVLTDDRDVQLLEILKPSR